MNRVLSRINTTQYPSYRLHKPLVAGKGTHAGAAGGASAAVGGVTPRRTTVRAESVEVGAACGLSGVTLVSLPFSCH